MSRKFLDQCLRSVDKMFMRKNQLSFQGRHDYLMGTKNMIRELHKGGYQLSHISHIKPRHVEYLIKTWQANNISNATTKNRMSMIRYVFKDLHKEHLLPKANHDLEIGSRSYISDVNKAIEDIDISRFDDPLIRYSVQLQQHFGLRREEGIKFIPSYADRGDHIVLKESWTKGGLGRIIPVLTEAQRALLDELKNAIEKNCSLIPKDKSYSDQRKAYDYAVQKAGYRNLHGLRHAYAQKRYYEITNDLTQGKGWQSPFNGGKHTRELNHEEHKIDIIARLKVSAELGHARRQITNVYLAI